MFRVSIKTTLFEVFSEKLPLFAALLIFTTLENECFLFLLFFCLFVVFFFFFLFFFVVVFLFVFSITT